VRIVLKDRDPVLGGDGDHVFSPLQTERNAAWILKIRNEIEQFWFALRFVQNSNQGACDNALVVCRYINVLSLIRVERLDGAEVGRILDDNRVARIEQHFADEIEALLRAADDEHLIGRALYVVDTPKILAYPLAQRRIAFRNAIL